PEWDVQADVPHLLSSCPRADSRRAPALRGRAAHVPWIGRARRLVIGAMARVKKLSSSGRPASKEQLAALKDTVKNNASARPGVYRMLAEDGGVLYVGKSKRVRARLLGHLRGRRGAKSALILRETHRIEWEYTPNEFAALLHELRLIKR